MFVVGRVRVGQQPRERCGEVRAGSGQSVECGGLGVKNRHRERVWRVGGDGQAQKGSVEGWG
eukprot:366387-Chlamydomonas_euryale.AAC.8